jgi:hypothetical protein
MPLFYTFRFPDSCNPQWPIINQSLIIIKYDLPF